MSDGLSAEKAAHPDRLYSSGPEPFGACPDDGRCWHGCPLATGGYEGKGSPCWRVTHAAPLSSYGETWTAEDRARHRPAEVSVPDAEKATHERYALRWAAGGIWQWMEFDSRQELLEVVDADRGYFFNPEWSRGTQVWRLDTTVLPPAEGDRS